MRGQRFEEVLRNCREGTPLELTPEEKEHGWHYCPEDQGQLSLQRLVGGKPWCGCKLSKEQGCATISDLDTLMQSMDFIKRCKKFEYVDGIPTLTVGPGVYYDILSCIARANLSRIGFLGGHGAGTVVSVCGVKLKMEE